jgi:hypothetical protein
MYPRGRYLRAMPVAIGASHNRREGSRRRGPPRGPRFDHSMASLHDRCPECARRLVTTRFDATFRLPDRTERLCFGIPGGLCEDCHQLYIDPGLIELLDLTAGRCVFAIESDLVLQEQAWSSAD